MAYVGSMINCSPVVERSTTIAQAAREMERSGVGALLVVEDDRPVGIVTDRDIVVRGVARDIDGDGRIDALMSSVAVNASRAGSGGGLGAGDRAGAGGGAGISAGVAATSRSAVFPHRRGVLRAHRGDTLVVHSHVPRTPDRLGEICGVRSDIGDPPFAVRWADTGHVSFVFPGPDAEVRAQPCGV